MKTQRNIFIAFILNLLFAAGEFAGGLLTGSIAILSDALHDLGDAAAIGLAYFLERKSNQPPDSIYTYGKVRYSVLSAMITSGILLAGSVFVSFYAFKRLLTPAPVEPRGMLVFALAGICVNGCAAYFTREKDSLNQKAVNLHMLEDILGWVVVFVGSVIIYLTDMHWIDPVMSICVAAFISFHAAKNLKEAVDIFLEKAPQGIDANCLEAKLRQLEGVSDVHHIHIWTLDGQQHCATMHVVADGDRQAVKARINQALADLGISHRVLELEEPGESCCAPHCHPPACHHGHHGHHH